MSRFGITYENYEWKHNGFKTNPRSIITEFSNDKDFMDTINTKLTPDYYNYCLKYPWQVDYLTFNWIFRTREYKNISYEVCEKLHEVFELEYLSSSTDYVTFDTNNSCSVRISIGSGLIEYMLNNHIVDEFVHDEHIPGNYQINQNVYTRNSMMKSANH